MPILDSVTAFLRRLHSSSWRYNPRETPKPIICTPLETLCKQDSEPLDMRDGATAVFAGILREPAPLYVLLIFPLLLFDVFKSPFCVLPGDSSTSISGSGPSSAYSGRLTKLIARNHLFIIFISDSLTFKFRC